MLLKMTDEQMMLEDMIASMVADAPLDENGELPGAFWPQMAELGLLAIPFSEDDGGLGGSAVELSILARRLGKVPGELPLTGSLVYGSSIIAELATPSLKAELLPHLIKGTEMLAVAHGEPDSRYRLSFVNTSISRRGGSTILKGCKTAVIGGATADRFIVSARTSGSATDHEGITLFLVPADAAGVRVTRFVTHDGRHDADVTFDDVELPEDWQLGETGAALPTIERYHDLTIAVACAEAVGAMEELLELSVDYLKIRKQFGVPLASFQVLKHKAVDMFIEVELAKSMTAFAIMTVDEAGPEASLALQAAKAKVNAAARFVAEAAVQLHGGIGMTMETRVGRLFQRLTNFQLRHSDMHTCLRNLTGASASILDI